MPAVMLMTMAPEVVDHADVLAVPRDALAKATAPGHVDDRVDTGLATHPPGAATRSVTVKGGTQGDVFVDLIGGAGVGGGPHVRVSDRVAGPSSWSPYPYAGFQGGIRVASGDINGAASVAVTIVSPGGMGNDIITDLGG